MVSLLKKCAFIYDFDLTLSEEYQQMPIFRKHEQNIKSKYGVNSEEYLPVLCGSKVAIGGGGLLQMIIDAQDIFPELTEEAMKREFAPQIQLAPGLPNWFERINAYAKTLHLNVSHHVISAGCASLIAGTSIAPYLSCIDAGEFIESNSSIYHIKKIVEPFNKTKWIKSICKGKENIDRHIAFEEYNINYDHVIIFADGFTDRDAINFIRERGGYAIGVYKEDDLGDFEKAETLLSNKVHFLVPRNYSPDTLLEDAVLRAMNRISSKICNYYYPLIDGLPLGHVSHQELWALTNNHLKMCHDCQQRSKPTELYPPKIYGAEKH